MAQQKLFGWERMPSTVKAAFLLSVFHAALTFFGAVFGKFDLSPAVLVMGVITSAMIPFGLYIMAKPAWVVAMLVYFPMLFYVLLGRIGLGDIPFALPIPILLLLPVSFRAFWRPAPPAGPRTVPPQPS